MLGSMFRVSGRGPGVQDFGFGAQGLKFRAWGPGFWVLGLLLDVWGHVAGSGLRRRVSLLVLAFALTSNTAMTTVQWSLSFHCKLCSHIAPSNHGRVRAVPVIHELPIRRSHPRSLIDDAALFVATIISGTTSPSVLSNVSRLSLYEDANPFASMAVLARTAWLLVCFVHSAAFTSTTNDTTRPPPPPPPPPPFCCYDCSCCRSWRWQQCGVGGGSNGSVAGHVGGSGADIPSSCGPVCSVIAYHIVLVVLVPCRMACSIM